MNNEYECRYFFEPGKINIRLDSESVMITLDELIVKYKNAYYSFVI